MNLVPYFLLIYLAKKYHPDALKEEDKEKSKVIFYDKPYEGFVQRNY